MNLGLSLSLLMIISPVSVANFRFTLLVADSLNRRYSPSAQWFPKPCFVVIKYDFYSSIVKIRDFRISNISFSFLFTGLHFIIIVIKKIYSRRSRINDFMQLAT